MNERDLNCKEECQLSLRCALRKMCHDRIRKDIQPQGYVVVDKESGIIEVLRDGCRLGVVSEGHFTPLT